MAEEWKVQSWHLSEEFPRNEKCFSHQTKGFRNPLSWTLSKYPASEYHKDSYEYKLFGLDKSAELDAKIKHKPKSKDSKKRRSTVHVIGAAKPTAVRPPRSVASLFTSGGLIKGNVLKKLRRNTANKDKMHAVDPQGWFPNDGEAHSHGEGEIEEVHYSQDEFAVPTSFSGGPQQSTSVHYSQDEFAVPTSFFGGPQQSTSVHYSQDEFATELEREPDVVADTEDGHDRSWEDDQYVVEDDFPESPQQQGRSPADIDVDVDVDASDAPDSVKLDLVASNPLLSEIRDYGPEQLVALFKALGYNQYGPFLLRRGMTGKAFLYADEIDLSMAGVTYRPHRLKLLGFVDRVVRGEYNHSRGQQLMERMEKKAAKEERRQAHKSGKSGESTTVPYRRPPPPREPYPGRRQEEQEPRAEVKAEPVRASSGSHKKPRPFSAPASPKSDPLSRTSSGAGSPGGTFTKLQYQPPEEHPHRGERGMRPHSLSPTEQFQQPIFQFTKKMLEVREGGRPSDVLLSEYAESYFVSSPTRAHISEIEEDIRSFHSPEHSLGHTGGAQSGNWSQSESTDGFVPVGSPKSSSSPDRQGWGTIEETGEENDESPTAPVLATGPRKPWEHYEHEFTSSPTASRTTSALSNVASCEPSLHDDTVSKPSITPPRHGRGDGLGHGHSHRISHTCSGEHAQISPGKSNSPFQARLVQRQIILRNRAASVIQKSYRRGLLLWCLREIHNQVVMARRNRAASSIQFMVRYLRFHLAFRKKRRIQHENALIYTAFVHNSRKHAASMRLQAGFRSAQVRKQIRAERAAAMVLKRKIRRYLENKKLSLFLSTKAILRQLVLEKEEAERLRVTRAREVVADFEWQCGDMVESVIGHVLHHELPRLQVAEKHATVMKFKTRQKNLVGIVEEQHLDALGNVIKTSRDSSPEQIRKSASRERTNSSPEQIRKSASRERTNSSPQTCSASRDSSPESLRQSPEMSVSRILYAEYDQGRQGQGGLTKYDFVRRSVIEQLAPNLVEAGVAHAVRISSIALSNGTEGNEYQPPSTGRGVASIPAIFEKLRHDLAEDVEEIAEHEENACPAIGQVLPLSAMDQMSFESKSSAIAQAIDKSGRKHMKRRHSPPTAYVPTYDYLPDYSHSYESAQDKHNDEDASTGSIAFEGGVSRDRLNSGASDHSSALRSNTSGSVLPPAVSEIIIACSSDSSMDVTVIPSTTTLVTESAPPVEGAAEPRGDAETVVVRTETFIEVEDLTADYSTTDNVEEGSLLAVTAPTADSTTDRDRDVPSTATSDSVEPTVENIADLPADTSLLHCSALLTDAMGSAGTSAVTSANPSPQKTATSATRLESTAEAEPIGESDSGSSPPVLASRQSSKKLSLGYHHSVEQQASESNLLDAHDDDEMEEDSPEKLLSVQAISSGPLFKKGFPAKFQRRVPAGVRRKPDPPMLGSHSVLGALDNMDDEHVSRTDSSKAVAVSTPPRGGVASSGKTDMSVSFQGCSETTLPPSVSAKGTPSRSGSGKLSSSEELGDTAHRRLVGGMTRQEAVANYYAPDDTVDDYRSTANNLKTIAQPRAQGKDKEKDRSSPVPTKVESAINPDWVEVNDGKSTFYFHKVCVSVSLSCAACYHKFYYLF